MTSLGLLLCATLILISAFMSASEVALFSLSRFQLRSIKETLRSSHRKIRRLLSDPGGLLITILVVNECVNISLSTLVTQAISKAHFRPPAFLPKVPDWVLTTIIGLLITAPIVLFLCEITPKVIAARGNQLIAPLSAGPLLVIYEAFKPVRILMRRFILLISRVTDRWKPQSEPHFSEPQADGKLLRESDFLLMAEEGYKEGAIQQNELELIRKVFELDDTTVGEIHTPLAQVQTLAVNTPLKSALHSVRGQRYSRIPVTGGSKKQVVGILYSKDLAHTKLETDLLDLSIAAIMRKPLFVSPSMKLNALFRKFKQQRIHMAIVQSPVNEAVGVITMSDILDVLFEDILADDDDFDQQQTQTRVRGKEPHR